MKTINFSARTAPSSAFGTFSPAEKRGGEGLSTIHSVRYSTVRNGALTGHTSTHEAPTHECMPQHLSPA